MRKIINTGFFLFTFILIISNYNCNEKENGEIESIISNPNLIIAHGAIIDADGNIIPPEADYILDAQKYYVSMIWNSIKKNSPNAGVEINKTIFSLVNDRVLANALFLDWLLEEYQSENNSYLTKINNALRWYYVKNIQKDPILPKGDEGWAKGITPDIAFKLEDAGIDVFAASLSGGAEYIKDCKEAGVPIPDKLFDSNWEKLGILQDQILFPGEESEMWMFTSNDPQRRGFCLSLSRSKDGGRNGLLDVICFGIQSNNACFFESEDNQGNADHSFPLDVVSDFVNLSGGSDLSNCTKCHAGENPYIVHPDDQVFKDAIAKKVADLGQPANLMGTDWYTGLPSGSQDNLNFNNNLTASLSQSNCTNCHISGNAGRFPEITSTGSSYCTHVLQPTLGLVGTGNNLNSNFSATMPLGEINNIGNYIHQIDQLLTECGISDAAEHFAGQIECPHRCPEIHNTFIGVEAGRDNTEGRDNTFVGYYAGIRNSSGRNNTFIGSSAGVYNTTGRANIFVGNFAGYRNTTGFSNTFVGDGAGVDNSTANYNTFLGYRAGNDNINAGSNTFIGANAGQRNTSGDRNTFVGTSAGLKNTTGTRNTILGFNAGHENTTGFFNIFVGPVTGYHNTTGFSNTFVGNLAGTNNDTGNNNTFIGDSAGKNTKGNMGSQNTFVGASAGIENTTGFTNTFLGFYAGFKNNTGNGNTYLGHGAGRHNTIGDRNTFIGRSAGAGNVEGSRNVFIGYQAGNQETGSNKLYIDNRSTHNPLIYGEFDSRKLRLNGAVEVSGRIRLEDVPPGFGRELVVDENGNVFVRMTAGEFAERIQEQLAEAVSQLEMFRKENQLLREQLREIYGDVDELKKKFKELESKK
mgnify:CR=1 FL=1